MRDAAGELAYRFHLLCLAQLIFAFAQRLLGLESLGDVTRYEHNPILRQRRYRRLEGDPFAANVQVIGQIDRRAAVERLADVLEKEIRLIAWQNLVHPSPDQLGGWTIQAVVGARRDVQVGAISIENENDVLHRSDERPRACLCALQRLLRELAIADVDDLRDEVRRLSVLVADESRGEQRLQ